MSLLGKNEIQRLVDNGIVEATGKLRFEVKDATLDLTIGDIFVPPTDAATPAPALNCRKANGYILNSGMTAIVRTAETIKLPKNVGAIGFPPSTNVSLSGLLTTNPGHVDPGFYGQLHLTAINMGREPFALVRGERIMRLMLFRIEGPAVVPTRAFDSPITDELLNKLSPDFLSVNRRVDLAVAKAGWKTALFPVIGPIVAAAIAAFSAIWLGTTGLKDDVTRLQAKVEAIGSKIDLGSIDARLTKLEKAGTVKPTNP